MKHLSAGPQRSYGSISEVKCVGTINGGPGDRGDSPLLSTTARTDMERSRSDSNPNQEQSFRSSLDESRPSYYTPAMVDELRKRNRLYFLDPITKLRYFHGFPWKLTFQIAKVVIIAVQIIIFGSQRQSVVEFFENSNLAFKHLLLLKWDPSYETMPYPPSTGKYAIYDLPFLYDHLNYAMDQYHKLPAQSLAAMELTRDSTGMPIPIELCFAANDVVIFPNHTYVVRAGVIRNCTYVYPENGTIGNFTYDIEKFIRETGLPIVFNSNAERSGQILVSLTSLPSEVPCQSQTLSDKAAQETKEVRVHYIALDASVMAICCLSTILCARSLKRCNKLRRVFNISTANYELCSGLLGIGVLLTFVGILRYLGFFKSYNVLILTVKTSFPHVLRFLVCALCLYTGFLLCGWTIFSPYNIKFRSLSSASECLFSLVNGDDMFVSFSALSNSSDAIWYVNRAYLYIFISLFIYVVISVFLAVIMDNYENLKNHYGGNQQDTVIVAFMKEDGEMPLTEVFSHVSRNPRSWQAWFFCIFPCLASFSKRFSAADGDTQTYAEVEIRGNTSRERESDSNYLTQDVF
ncbi:mucolipin-3-like [Elysia marginata]|uniref:Mucolipin-3-like n=1 Tax=Elysia marginata TaxID=1093978 RepID=A0AAV4HVU1_9GAST|nr:mucolipin-3-like [Elysia marginata]